MHQLTDTEVAWSHTHTNALTQTNTRIDTHKCAHTRIRFLPIFMKVGQSNGLHDRQRHGQTAWRTQPLIEMPTAYF